jgi:hypothetical protein
MLGPRRITVALGVTVILASFSSLAFAGEVTRDSYREAVEPICKQNTEANERILGGVRAEVRVGRLKPAAVQFEKAAKELKQTIGQLKPVPRPAADRSRLSRWIGKVEGEGRLFEVVAAKLRHGEQTEAQRMVVKLTTNAGNANRIVIPFEFEYCLLEPARFT